MDKQKLKGIKRNPLIQIGDRLYVDKGNQDIFEKEDYQAVYFVRVQQNAIYHDDPVPGAYRQEPSCIRLIGPFFNAREIDASASEENGRKGKNSDYGISIIARAIPESQLSKLKVHKYFFEGFYVEYDWLFSKHNFKLQETEKSIRALAEKTPHKAINDAGDLVFIANSVRYELRNSPPSLGHESGIDIQAFGEKPHISRTFNLSSFSPLYNHSMSQEIISLFGSVPISLEEDTIDDIIAKHNLIA